MKRSRLDILDASIAKQKALVEQLQREVVEAEAREQARQVELQTKVDERHKRRQARVDELRRRELQRVVRRRPCKPRTKHPRTSSPTQPRATKKRTATVAALLKSCGEVCDLTMENSAACGAQTTILLPSAESARPRQLRARYCLVDSRDLIPSHDPETFEPSSRYPKGLQERVYHRDQSEQLGIVAIAQNSEPGSIFNTSTQPVDGPPIVTRGGVVLGGNKRTMGLQLHYRRGGRVFADYLRQNALDFGLRPEEIDRVPVAHGGGPVVVRVVSLGEDNWKKAVRDFNTSLTFALDLVTESAAIASQLQPEVFEVLARGLAEDESDLGEYLASRRSVPLIEALRRSHVITANNQSRLLRSDGLLSTQARELFVAALGAAVVGDADLLEHAGAEIRNALARSAPYWLAASAFGGGWDVRVPMRLAIRDLLAVRNSGLPLRRWRQQTSMFEAPKTADDPMGQRLLVILDQRSGPVQLSRIAKAFAGDAAMFGGRQQTLVEPRSAIAAIEAAAKASKLDLRE